MVDGALCVLLMDDSHPKPPLTLGSFPSKLRGRYELHGVPVVAQYWYERMHDWPGRPSLEYSYR